MLASISSFYIGFNRSLAIRFLQQLLVLRVFTIIPCHKDFSTTPPPPKDGYLPSLRIPPDIGRKLNRASSALFH